LLFAPRVFAFTGPDKPIPASSTQSPVAGLLESKETVLEHYSQQKIDGMLAGTTHPTILRKLIKCESQNVNIARMDSNNLMSFGLLQFNGTATWQQFSPLANVTGSLMMPDRAIAVADWMISHGQLHRWACAYITGLLK
jgi:hypothetical protein